MPLPAPARATYEELLKVPENLVAEIVGGELVTSPRPGGRHANAASALGGQLFLPFHRGRGGPGGWVILFEPELHLDREVLVPDLAGWRRERMPRVPDVAHFDIRPDWVCEVVSPSTGRVDRVGKIPIYARSGVPHLWLVDPTARTHEVFRLESERWVLLATHGGDEMVRAEPFEAVEIDLLALWDEPRQGATPL